MHKLAVLFLLFNVFAVSGCRTVPTMPDIDIGLVDVKHAKHHIYRVPKQRGQSAEYLRSEPLSLQKLNKHFTLSPSNYSKVEQHISTLEDWGAENCQ